MHKMSKHFFLVITFILITVLFVGCAPEETGTLQTKLLPEQNVVVASEDTEETAKNEDVNQEVTKINDEAAFEGKMKVHFIDVGQGDATLIQTPGGKVILKDAGDSHMGGSVVSYIRSQGVDTIDLLIGSHPHVDHIGGMAEVIENFHIKKIAMPRVTHTTVTYENLLLTIEENGLKVKEAKAGVSFDIDPAVELMLVAPNSPQYTALNDYSAVLKVIYKDSSFLITGDAELHSEMEIIKNWRDIDIDVLRTGHHGSGTSSATQFLKATSPEFAILSVGENNRYNHPSRDVLARLHNSGAKIYRTDVHGTIVFTTDGQIYDINVKQAYQYTPSKEDTESSKTNSNSNSNSNPNHNPNPNPSLTTTPATAVEVEKIDINTAGLEELQEIIHIGAERAEEIIKVRPFSSIDDLSRVNGIGPARIRDIKEEGKAYVK